MPIPTLEEKLAWMKPEPPTEYELACVEKLSFGSYEIGVQRTNDILDEAMEVFMRSSRSSMGVAGDSIVSFNGELDLSEILTEKSIEGQWIYEFFARSVRPFKQGDVITLAFASGGAGYGDPLEREPELVLQDLQNKIISLWSAENIYKVLLDGSGRKIDQKLTFELRQKEYLQRLKQGLSYEDFLTQWSQKTPPPEILHSFGSWPEGNPNRMIMRA